MKVHQRQTECFKYRMLLYPDRIGHSFSFLKIRTGTERSATGTGQDNAPCGGSWRLGTGQYGQHFLGHLRIHRIR